MQQVTSGGAAPGGELDDGASQPLVRNDRGRRTRRRSRAAVTAIGALVDARLSRRGFLRASAVAGLGAAGALGAGGPVRALASSHPSSLTFQEISLQLDGNDHLPPGYSRRVLMRWGDPLGSGAPAFDPAAQTGASQALQWGYNNDFTAYLPMPGSDPNAHGLVYANHEAPEPVLMWAELGETLTRDQVDVTMASMGGSVIEVRKGHDGWHVVADSPYARRVASMFTEIAISGPAAGHPWMRTAADPTGTRVIGTHNNCNGGVTPWGTILTCEEGSGEFFSVAPDGHPLRPHWDRYYYDAEDADELGWSAHYDRFDLAKEPNEWNRFEWVVEIDPFDPQAMPVKRTALGRFAHEGAHTALSPDGRVVVYLGDDWEFEYCYKFVSNGIYNPDDRAANRDLLDDGTLYVARFEDDGTMAWLPLVHGEGPLTAANGFESQGQVLIETRRAADLLGATPMDGPEGYAPNPATGRIYIALTENEDRETEAAPNPRAPNDHGHILELIPPGADEGAADHAAERFRWAVFILCGDPTDPAQRAAYHPQTSDDGWFTDPDNIGFDPQGRMWVCTDGVQPQGHDGLYAMDTQGDGRALPKLFYSPPSGGECCSPWFTPDGTAMFLSVQHPGDGDLESLADATTLWPDFADGMPPRPSLIVITKDDGGPIGS